MAINIEWKARARDFQHQQTIAIGLAGSLTAILHQRDTFFRVPHGRLKLRKLGPDDGDLIAYERVDQAGPKASHFMAAKTRFPDEVRQIYAGHLGVLGEVTKTRWLYLVGQSRIHFDQVEDLGEFIEVEVVLREGQTSEEGTMIAEDLRRSLGVTADDLIATAYLDLLLNRSLWHGSFLDGNNFL